MLHSPFCLIFLAFIRFVVFILFPINFFFFLRNRIAARVRRCTGKRGDTARQDVGPTRAGERAGGGGGAEGVHKGEEEAEYVGCDHTSTKAPDPIRTPRYNKFWVIPALSYIFRVIVTSCNIHIPSYSKFVLCYRFRIIVNFGGPGIIVTSCKKDRLSQ